MKKIILLCLFILPVSTFAQSVACSCVQGARTLVPEVPHVDAWAFDTFVPQTPKVGSIAVFRYPKDYHVAVVTAVDELGFWIFESNFHTCQFSDRFIKWNDPYLLKFVLS